MQTRPAATRAATSRDATPRDLPILYFKPDCRWCQEVFALLDDHRIPYQARDITRDSGARARMVQISGQTKVPTMDWNGDVLADFGIEELLAFLRARNVKFTDD